MSDIEQDAESLDEPKTVGPVLWLNWNAQAAGQPARTESRVHGSAFQPLWEEHTLYSDTSFTLGSSGVFGPYQLRLIFSGASQTGTAQPALILRSNDHLGNAPLTLPMEPGRINTIRQAEDTSSFAGGRHGEQVASLLALALGRRLRSAGVTRHAMEGDSVGQAFNPFERVPVLQPAARNPVLPGMDAQAPLDDALPYLRAYARLSGVEAVAVQRAAHQFAEALWWSEADPRIAWIKLFGAVEAAADRWDFSRHGDAVEQLAARHPRMVKKLRQVAPEAVPVVAASLSRVIGAERKMVEFLMAHLPDPPSVRPAVGQLDYADMERHLSVLYDHRSRELHGGIPFPPALCDSPHVGDDGRPSEIFLGLAVSGEGGYWPAARLPMLLHTFAYLAGAAIRRWWLGLGHRRDPDD